MHALLTTAGLSTCTVAQNLFANEFYVTFKIILLFDVPARMQSCSVSAELTGSFLGEYVKRLSNRYQHHEFLLVIGQRFLFFFVPASAEQKYQVNKLSPLTVPPDLNPSIMQSGITRCCQCTYDICLRANVCGRHMLPMHLARANFYSL